MVSHIFCWRISPVKDPVVRVESEVMLLVDTSTMLALGWPVIWYQSVPTLMNSLARLPAQKFCVNVLPHGKGVVAVPPDIRRLSPLATSNMTVVEGTALAELDELDDVLEDSSETGLNLQFFRPLCWDTVTKSPLSRTRLYSCARAGSDTRNVVSRMKKSPVLAYTGSPGVRLTLASHWFVSAVMA